MYFWLYTNVLMLACMNAFVVGKMRVAGMGLACSYSTTLAYLPSYMHVIIHTDISN